MDARRIGPVGVVLAAVGLFVLAGCDSTDTRGAACNAAFRNADPRALPAYGVSPLDDAVRTCRTVAEWQGAWDAVPSAHPGHEDAIAYLRDRCAVRELATTILCLEAVQGGSPAPS